MEKQTVTLIHDEHQQSVLGNGNGNGDGDGDGDG